MKIGILVVAYMLKDRLKEGARQRFARALQQRLWDRRVLITDPVASLTKSYLRYHRARRSAQKNL